MMEIKGYNRIKKINIKGWLSGRNSKNYAIILILLLAAVLFVFKSVMSMNDTEQNVQQAGADIEPSSQDVTQESSSEYVANNQKYKICINKAKNYVIVYTLDSELKFTKVYDQFWCSCNASLQAGETVISDKAVWYQINSSAYGHYANRFESGAWIYSVPYYAKDTSKLDVSLYNNLGKVTQIGSVYVAADKAKWIYENCGNNTAVEIYEDSSETTPSDLKQQETLSAGAKYDPSDMPSNLDGAVNTPINFMRVIDGVVIKVGDSYDPMNGTLAMDIYGNDITSYIRVQGTVDNKTPGVYTIEYILNDNFGTNLSYFRHITVTE